MSPSARLQEGSFLFFVMSGKIRLLLSPVCYFYLCVYNLTTPLVSRDSAGSQDGWTPRSPWPGLELQSH